MTESFQKSAKSLIELPLQHPGILDQRKFNQYFDLHCYKPSPALQPFVVHIWTQRLRKRLPQNQQLPIEILSGPTIYLLFTNNAAFIHGVGSKNFAYNPNDPATIAGVKFRPGGLHAFWPGIAATLTETVQPLNTIMPDLAAVPLPALLKQSDQDIVATIEAHLMNKQPKRDKNVERIQAIIDMVNVDSQQTVANVARKCGMSERSLQLLFHTYVGVGIKWVIMRRRLLQTVQLATACEPRLTWTDAAMRYGFNSHSHFTREFKKHVSVSPSQYAAHLSP